MVENIFGSIDYSTIDYSKYADRLEAVYLEMKKLVQTRDFKIAKNSYLSTEEVTEG